METALNVVCYQRAFYVPKARLDPFLQKIFVDLGDVRYHASHIFDFDYKTFQVVVVGHGSSRPLYEEEFAAFAKSMWKDIIP